MVNLQKTKRKQGSEWTLNGKKIAEIRVGGRGTEYFCLYLPPVTGEGNSHLRAVRDLRVSVLKDAAVWVVELAENHSMPPQWLESLLDYIYMELNRRLNKDS